MKIRAATENDINAVVALIGDLGYPMIIDERYKRVFQDLIKSSSAGVLLLEHESGEICGLLTYSVRYRFSMRGATCEIEEYLVSEKWRGQGFGKKLLAHVKTIAQQKGATRLTLEVSKKRESYRRRFFVKNGFAESDAILFSMDLRD